MWRKPKINKNMRKQDFRRKLFINRNLSCSSFSTLMSLLFLRLPLWSNSSHAFITCSFSTYLVAFLLNPACGQVQVFTMSESNPMFLTKLLSLIILWSKPMLSTVFFPPPSIFSIDWKSQHELQIRQTFSYSSKKTFNSSLDHTSFLFCCHLQCKQ